MQINEIYNPHDVLFAKLKGLKYNFSSDENDINRYCHENHIPGNLQSTADCTSIINDILKEIDNLINIQFDDDRLVLFQENALRIKNRLIKLRNSL